MARSKPRVATGALTAIEAFDAELAAADRRAATRRQRRWALTDLARYRAARLGVDPAELRTADLVDPDGVTGWLAAAVQGGTRTRGAGPSSAAAQRARLASVRAFADWAGLPAPTDPALPRIARLPGADPGEAALAVRILGQQRPAGVTEQVWIRTTALAALVLDTGARVGELAVLRIGDLHFERGPRAPGHARVPRRPPGHRLPAQTTTYDPAHLREIDFSPGTAAILRRWLGVRAGLVAELQGSEPHLVWVAVGAGGDAHGPPGQRPGMPLSARSLHRSWRRVADLLVTADVPGVPVRLGALTAGPASGAAPA